MAPFPDEVDVFTGPHWRMKHLVGLYCEKLSKTNFSNNSDFRSFLQSLCDTFKEFKMHEQIENEFIIGQLQLRSHTVYNVHSDNKLSDMLMLFQKGLRNVKNECEQLNYARQLKERLDAFTQDFLPHMREEEEVFQPMLMQYFSYEELKAIKQQVIAQHCSQSPAGAPHGAELLKGLSLWSHAQELQRVFKYSAHEKGEDSVDGAPVSRLPPELLLKVFQYLSPMDVCRCSRVCSTWWRVSRSGSLWKHLYPVRWARGDVYRGPPKDSEQEPNEEWVRKRLQEGSAYQQWDEDADVDETEELLEDSLAISTVQKEKQLINEMIHNLLPHIGPSVRSLILAYSSAVSSKMVRQILSLCPNLTYLDLTQTDITDSAFDSGVSWPLLEHVDLSGCERITDVTLKRLSASLGQSECDQWAGSTRQPLVYKRRSGARTRLWLLEHTQPTDIEDSAEPLNPPCCCGRNLRRRSFRTNLWSRHSGTCGHALCCSTPEGAGFRTVPGEATPTCGMTQSRPLRFLSLSGCYQITDLGLRFMSGLGLPHLEHLNLSGCVFVTAAGLQELVSVCPALKHEHFYYCDNINGPHADTASGCQNLQCGFRACCRSGE